MDAPPRLRRVDTAADHLRLLREAIEALPPALRRKIMATCDGAGASHDLVKELDRLARRHGGQVTWAAGWALSAREQVAIGKIPQTARKAATDGRGQVRERHSDDACGSPRCAHPACWIEEAHVSGLTGPLREGPDGDQLMLPTASTPASRTSSAPARTPAWATSPRTTT